MSRIEHTAASIDMSPPSFRRLGGDPRSRHVLAWLRGIVPARIERFHRVEGDGAPLGEELLSFGTTAAPSRSTRKAISTPTGSRAST